MGSVQRVICKRCGGAGFVQYFEGNLPCDLCDEQGAIKDGWIEYDEADDFLAQQEILAFGDYRHSHSGKLGIDL